MKTRIKCPYCRAKNTLNRKLPIGEEIVRDVTCSSCHRQFDIAFDDISNSPYILLYRDIHKLGFCISDSVEGIRTFKSEDAQQLKAYEIEYSEDSIEQLIDRSVMFKTDIVRCANCNKAIWLKREVNILDFNANHFGVFCNICTRRTLARYSNEFLSEFYDKEQEETRKITGQKLETETQTQTLKNEKQEELIMDTIVKSTIIGFVIIKEDKYKVYNPSTKTYSDVAKEDFEALCLGDFPYRKIRANTLADGELVQEGDRMYYVEDAAKNLLMDFETGEFSQKARKANLFVNTNTYIKYVPVLKKCYDIAEVTVGRIDPRISKMLEIVANDVDSTGTDKTVARLVRFNSDPEYADILDTDTLSFLIMEDPAAFAMLSQMTQMNLANSIMRNGGGIPLAVTHKEEAPNPLAALGKADLEVLLNSAVERKDYAAAAQYQKALNSITE